MGTARFPEDHKAPNTQTRDGHSWTSSYGLACYASAIIETLNP